MAASNRSNISEWMFDGNKDVSEIFSSNRPKTGSSKIKNDGRLMSRQGSAVGDFSSRPMTASSGRAGTATGHHRGIPGTASRLLASAAQSRPFSRSGIGLQTPVNVQERPVTQQGLSGLRTATGKGPHRQYQDKSYFMGLLRAKMAEIQAETSKLNREIDDANEEQSTYLAYDKRVKELAAELTESQGTLSDYNLLVDKINTDTSRADVEAEAMELKVDNDTEWKEVERLFEEKQNKEKNISQLEMEITQERYMADNIVAAMQPSLREKYLELKNQNISYQEKLEQMNQEMDALNSQKAAMEEEISLSGIKREAVAMHEQLRELEEKKADLIQEEKQRGTPAEERERLLQRVKDDNAEISTMERQILQIQESIQILNEEMNQIDQDLEENQSERNQKYRELRKREETMDIFLNSFQESKASELERLADLESKIQELTESMSRDIAHASHLPSSQNFSAMKDDLSFKQGEMEKSKSTLDGVVKERAQLQNNLEKMGALEEKIQTEMITLKEKVKIMEDEMVVYMDLDQLRKDADNKRDSLEKLLEELSERKAKSLVNLNEIKSKYEDIEKTLADNETHTQLTNLERKWSHLEQNNFTVEEFIANKKAELDIQPTKASVMKLQREYNKRLIKSIKNTP